MKKKNSTASAVFSIFGLMHFTASAQPEVEITFHREFSTSGSEYGYFDEPRSVAVDSRDRIIVTDYDNNLSPDASIHICDGWGRCSGFGAHGSEVGQFSRAHGVAVDSNDQIIIADYFNNRIQVCSDSGSCRAFGGNSGNSVTLSQAGSTTKAEPGLFDSPSGVAVDSNDQIIVADSGNHRVQVCDQDGNCSAFGSQGTGVGQFDAPRSLTVDREDRIIVADSGNHRIQVCDQQGSCSAFGQRGTAPGQFEWPWDAAVDSKGRIIVTDEGGVADGAGNRLQICNYEGQCSVYGTKGSNPGEFTSPRGVAVDSRDRIIVADLGNGRVQIFNTRGEFNVNSGLTDAWYFPETAGQGFLMTVFPDIGQMFLAWFTFDLVRPDDSNSADLGDIGHRWLTAQGPFSGSQAALTTYSTSGGVFDSEIPVPESVANGEITLEFDNCNSGRLTYGLPDVGVEGVIPIQRIVYDNVPRCRSLDEQLASQ